jgi:hypothetical protein
MPRTLYDLLQHREQRRTEVAEAMATFAARVAEGYAPMQPALRLWENGEVDVGPSPALVGTEGMAAWVDLPLTLTPCPMCPGPIATENADLVNEFREDVPPETLSEELLQERGRRCRDAG